MAFTRSYPSQIIPANPSAADFETNYRNNTETFKIVVQDIDDEVSTARGNFDNLTSRLNAFSTVDGALLSSAPSTGFWTNQENITMGVGVTSFTTTGNYTSTFVANRPLKINTSSITQYGHVVSSSYNAGTGLTTVVTDVTTGDTVNSILYATQEPDAVYKISPNNVTSDFFDESRAFSVAVAIALG